MVNNWLIATVAGLAPALAWRDLGGSAIFFTWVKNYLFGKTLRTVEYPHGDLKTISVRFATVNAVKKKIAEVNGVHSYHDIKQLYRHEDNFWAEPLQSGRDIRLLNDNNWVLWTKSYSPIPSKGVNLKELNSQIEPVKSTDEEEEFVLKTAAAAVNPSATAPPEPIVSADKAKGNSPSASSPDKKYADPHLYTDKYKISLNAVKISALNFVSQCRNEAFLQGDVEGGPLTEKEYQALIDLVLDEDSYLISLYHNFKDDPKLFVKYSRKKAQDAMRRAEKKKEEAAKQAAVEAIKQYPAQPEIPQPPQQPTPSTSTPVPPPKEIASSQSIPHEVHVDSDEEKRKKKLEHLIHEYKTGKDLVEEIKHPKTTQDENKKKEETTTTATWIA